MKQLFRTLTLVVLPLLAVSCNTDYNFDNISLEMTVGDTEGISIPVGSTGQITLSSLLEGTDVGVTEDGYYGFEYGDSFEYTIELSNTIAPISGLIPTIAPIESQLLGSLNAEVPTFSAKKSIDFPEGISGGITITDTMLGLIGNTFSMHQDPHTFENSFEVEVPAEVAAVKEITFGPNGEGSHIDLTFDLGGLADVCKSCTIDNFNIELPAGFTLAKVEGTPESDYITISNGENSTTPNHIVIKDYTISGTTFSVSIIVKKIDLSNMEIENGVVNISQDVTYDLDFSGTLKAGTVEAVSPSVSIVADDLEVYKATIVAGKVEMEFNFSEQISESISVPEELVRIDYLEIAKAGTDGTQAPEFSVGVLLEGAPMESVTLSDVVLTLPEFLDIEAPEGWNYADGKLTTPSLTLLNNSTNDLLKLTIKGIKSLPIAYNKLNLNSTIGLSAKAGIAEGSEITINTSAQHLKLTPIVTLDDISIVKVTGLIDPDLSDLLEPQVIELDEFTSALDGFDMDLNIASPVLSLIVENPIGVGIDASVKIKGYKDDYVINVLNSPVMTILPADGDTPTTTHIIINGDAAPDSPNYQLVQMDGFADLIASLPDKIEVQLSAETNKDRAHTLVLKSSYDFKVEYAVEAALKFDNEKDGHISYTVDVEDVDLSMLEDIDIIVESLVLKVATESTLPVDLTMGVEFLDEAGSPIECITATTEGKIEGSKSDTAKESECDITLTIAQNDSASSKLSPFAQIAQTKKIRCKLEGTTLAGCGLKPDQYISANISLLLDKGITVDLGSLLPEEEEPIEE